LQVTWDILTGPDIQEKYRSLLSRAGLPATTPLWELVSTHIEGWSDYRLECIAFRSAGTPGPGWGWAAVAWDDPNEAATFYFPIIRADAFYRDVPVVFQREWKYWNGWVVQSKIYPLGFGPIDDVLARDWARMLGARDLFTGVIRRERGPGRRGTRKAVKQDKLSRARLYLNDHPDKNVEDAADSVGRTIKTLNAYADDLGEPRLSEREE
jgi:hypothetical protein